MTSEVARERAEKLFRHDDNKGNGSESMAEYQASAVAVREKTARLKALRLAKEAEALATPKCKPK